jgi:hypothetical protein
MADARKGSAVVAACLARSFVAILVPGAPASCAGMVVEREHRIAGDDIGHKMGHWPKRDCSGPSVVQSMPGHGGVLPVGSGRCGGALGWLQRAKASMMIMCTTTWTRRAGIERFFRHVVIGRRCDRQ